MRLNIISADRLGITQEMLCVIVENGWNLASIEMCTYHTYVRIRDRGVSFDVIKKNLSPSLM